MHVHTHAGTLEKSPVSMQESAETCWNYLLQLEVIKMLGMDKEGGTLIAQNKDDLERAKKRTRSWPSVHSLRDRCLLQL
jgi:hypothetical protein